MSENSHESRQFECLGKTYRLDPDGPTLRKIRDDFNVNLAMQSGYVKLRTDAVLLSDVMEYLCRQQRVDNEVSQREFARGVMQNRDSALEALVAVMTDFMPPDLAEELNEKKTMSTTDLATSLMEEMMMESLAAGDATMIGAAMKAAMSD